jgi:hypothetical protein
VFLPTESDEVLKNGNARESAAEPRAALHRNLFLVNDTEQVHCCVSIAESLPLSKRGCPSGGHEAKSPIGHVFIVHREVVDIDEIGVQPTAASDCRTRHRPEAIQVGRLRA